MRARGPFGFVSGAVPGALCEPGAGLVHFLHQLFAPGNFLRQGLRGFVLLLGALGGLQEFVQVLLQLGAPLPGAPGG